MQEPQFPRTLAESISSAIGLRHCRIREIIGLGAVNYVFVLTAPEDNFVVRFPRDPLDTDDYSKEEWCLNEMASAGIRTPEFIGRGTASDRPYIVQTFIEGTHGDLVRTKSMWRELGRYARIINKFPLTNAAPDSLFPRFGRNLTANWANHIAYNIQELNLSDHLLASGAYPLGLQDKLKRLFEGLEHEIRHFGLTHGDVVPKNTIVTSTNELFLLDWGSASTGPYPFTDFGRIFFDAANEGFHAEDLADFCDGYGTEFSSIQSALTAKRVLDAIDVCRWAIDKRPDRLAEYSQRASKIVDEFTGWI